MGISASKTTCSRTGDTEQPFTWNGAYGYEYNPATGLYHVGAREYDPRTGRWLQRDPIDASSGDPNLYRYVGNDPVNQVDPDGTDWNYHDLLDVAGFIPGLGEVADLANAIGYALEGDWTNAGISAAGMLPGGDALKAGRLGKKIVQEVVEEGAEQVAKREAKNTLQEQGKKKISSGGQCTKRRPTKQLRDEWEKKHGQSWPRDDNGKPQVVHHKIPLADGGPDTVDNIEPMKRKDHIEHHKKRGDFARWGKRGAERRKQKANSSSGRKKR